MRYLYTSKGKHIANEIDGILHAVTGRAIGYFLPEYGIYVDPSGRYLGEILYENRLLVNRSSPYRSIQFGAMGRPSSAERFRDPGKLGSVGMPSGYRDIDAQDL